MPLAKIPVAARWLDHQVKCSDGLSNVYYIRHRGVRLDGPWNSHAKADRNCCSTLQSFFNHPTVEGVAVLSVDRPTPVCLVSTPSGTTRSSTTSLMHGIVAHNRTPYLTLLTIYYYYRPCSTPVPPLCFSSRPGCTCQRRYDPSVSLLDPSVCVKPALGPTLTLDTPTPRIERPR
jgi:hypothetical protein